MAHIWEDRVLEVSTTTGTGDFTLAGAVTGFRTFASVSSVSDTVYYFIEAVDAAGVPTGEWETGLGTYSAANVLTRTTVLESSNAGAAVNFSAGSKRVGLSSLASFVGPASSITNVPAGNIAATDVQAAINELDGEKVAKAGDTMTGALNLPANGLAVGTNQLVVMGGKVGIGLTSPQYTLDVIDSLGFLVGNSRTAGVDKAARTFTPSYSAAVNGVAVSMYSFSNSSNNLLNIGGGTSIGQAATTINFYTASAVDTATGTNRFSITGDGNIQVASNTVIDSNRLHHLRQYTVATLPAAGTAGRLAAVTDASAPTYNATVAGGGAVKIPVYDNGTNWVCH